MLNQAIINLNTLRKNALEIKKKLNKNVKFCAVVKADAYGHGIEKIANALYPYVDCYAVALLEEGIKLRLCGIDKDILLLTPPFKEDVEKGIENDITFAVDSVSLVKYIDKISKQKSKVSKIHIAFNTGMNRFGIDSISELEDFLIKTQKLKNVYIEGLFSHYAKPQEKKSIVKATNKFLLAINTIKSYNKKAICHISASGGFLCGNHFDMVRVGILLYGYMPFSSNYIKVKPIMKIKIPIVKTRVIKPFEKCLYNEKINFIKRKVGLIRYGYADGLNRKQIKGQFNNRCMDISMITYGNGKKQVVITSVKNLSKQYKTIDYEILTKIAIRARKIYIN